MRRRRLNAPTVVCAVTACAALLAVTPPVLGQTPLTLDDAMRRARADTGDARALDASIGEADARIRGARSGFWPRVDLTETVQRGNQPVFVFSSLLAQRRFSAANFGISALNDPAPITNTRTALTLTQPIFDAGSTRFGVATATFGRADVTAHRDAARQDLALRAAQAFVQVLQLEAVTRTTDAAVMSAESDLRRARARRDVGLVTEADVLVVDVHLADMRQRQIAASGDLTVARLQLAESVGLPLAEPIAPVRPVPTPTDPDVDALVRNTVSNHPLVRQADALVRLADDRRRAARAALWPAIDVQAGLEFNGASLTAQESSWSVGAQMRLNLFRGFGDQARITEAQQAQARAIAERGRVARRVEVEIRAAIAQLAAARGRQDAGRAALAQARESQRIIRDRYDTGLAGVTDVLRAAEITLEAESRATAAEMDVVLRTVALDRALGRL